MVIAQNQQDTKWPNVVGVVAFKQAPVPCLLSQPPACIRNVQEKICLRLA